MRFPQRLLDKMLIRVPYSAFIETGTHTGDTAMFMANRFPVFTVELDKGLHARFTERVQSSSPKHSVDTFCGSSPRGLSIQRSRGRFNKPCVFWLDAHWCGGPKQGRECPLLDELEEIPNLSEHLIVIDDARLFINPPPPPHKPEDWPSFRDIERFVKAKDPACVLRLVDDSIVIAHEKYAEVIGEPEAVPSGILRMPLLGQMGRFGNQIFQYMFLRCYARQWNMLPVGGSWIGNELFCLPPAPNLSAPMDHRFEEVTEHDRNNTLIPHRPERLPGNVDVAGYFQYHTSYYYPHKEFIQKLFTPGPEYLAYVQRAATELKRENRKLCVVHVRRGDYGRGYFYQTPTSWYVRALEDIFDRFGDVALYVATEDQSVLSEFAAFAPAVIEDFVKDKDRVQLKCNREKYELANPKQLAFFEDFHVMTQADVLLIPQSTFSFAAALLNQQHPLVLKSNLALGRFEQIDPWDCQPLDYTHNRANYPNVPGAWLDTNSAW